MRFSTSAFQTNLPISLQEPAQISSFYVDLKDLARSLRRSRIRQAYCCSQIHDGTCDVFVHPLSLRFLSTCALQHFPYFLRLHLPLSKKELTPRQMTEIAQHPSCFQQGWISASLTPTSHCFWNDEHKNIFGLRSLQINFSMNSSPMKISMKYKNMVQLI